MQEFIEYLEKDYYINELSNFDKDKIQFLEKEKEQIINDFLNGKMNVYDTKSISAEQYYKETYNEKI